MSYTILEIPQNLETPYSEMTRPGALAFFDWLNQTYLDRIKELASLVNETEGGIGLDYSVESLTPIGFWLKSALKIRQKTEKEIDSIVFSVPAWLKESVRTENQELTEKSLSIVFDLAIYFSRVLIENDERISWSMKTKASKYDADRNQLVLSGVTKLDVNPVRSIQNISFGIAVGKKGPERLGEFYHICKYKLLGR